MKLLDARDLAPGQTISADLCIVGSGPAGITLAMELADSGLSIVLLESGGFEQSPENRDLNRGRQLGIDSWSLDAWRMRAFGGASGHWQGFCRPLGPEDFEAREWLSGSGWPIGFETLRPYYERAHETCEVGRFDYDAAALSERIGAPLLTADDSVLEHRFYRLSPPTRFGLRYRSALEQADSIRAYLHANLVEIVLEDDLGAVTRLRCATLEGSEFSVQAERYVLAMGGLENARMLLASDAQLSAGVANTSGLVGQCFMEHPHYLRSATIAWSARPDLSFFRARYGLLAESEGSADIGLLGGIGLRAEVRESEALLNMTIALYPGDTLEDADTGEVGAGRVGALLGRPPGCVAVTRLGCRCEQSPYEASRLTLGEQRDALGIPRIELDWQVAEQDTRGYYRTLQIVGSELGRLGLGRIWTPHVGGNLRFFTEPGGHHMGTTRMGNDPERSVVDANLRSHDHDNLYLAGTSVFVTGGDANPTLTLVALAHRLADHLAGRA